MHSKTVLITGTNKGIGKGLAHQLKSMGYKVYGTSRTPHSSTDLDGVYTLDVTNQQSISDAISTMTHDALHIDLLINNAGIGSDYNEQLTAKENFELRFQTHVFGTFFFTEAITPLLKPDGKIINISSKLSSFAEVDNIAIAKFTQNKMAYILSKSSLNMYTKLLASRLREKQITVLSIHPGWVQTTLSTTNKNAPLSITTSVDGIIKLILKNPPTGTFWNAENQEELQW